MIFFHQILYLINAFNVFVEKAAQKTGKCRHLNKQYARKIVGEAQILARICQIYGPTIGWQLRQNTEANQQIHEMVYGGPASSRCFENGLRGQVLDGKLHVKMGVARAWCYL